MPASLIAAGDALARFFAAPEIGSVPHRSARQGILILVAFIGGMLPISNMAMLSSAYLALSGDFNADLIDLGRLALGNLLIMGLVQPLVNHIHAGLGLRGALFLALCVVSVAGVGAASSGSLTEMTLWYALAGFGGGLFLSLSARILFVAVPPESRRLMMAIWSFFIGFGSNLSPLLGGFLVEFLTWHSLFLLSPVVALPCLVILFFLLPDSRPAGMPPFDWCSFAFLVAFAVPTLIAVCYGQTFGWNSSFILIMIFCAVSALFLFLVSCLSAEAPLLHLRNLRIKGVGPAVMAALLLVISHVGMRIQMILFMRNVLGYPPSEIGLMFLLPLCVFVLTVVPDGHHGRHARQPQALPPGRDRLYRRGRSPALAARRQRGLVAHGGAAGSAELRLCDGQRFGHALPVAQLPAGEAAADAPGHQQRAFLQHVLVHGSITTLSVLLNKWYFALIAAQVTQGSSAASASISRWSALFAGQGLRPPSPGTTRSSSCPHPSKSRRPCLRSIILFLILSLVACVAFVCALLSRRVDPHPHAVRAHARNSLSRLWAAVRSRLPRPAFPLAGLLLCCLLAAGCTLGPDYKRPDWICPPLPLRRTSPARCSPANAGGKSSMTAP